MYPADRFCPVDPQDPFQYRAAAAGYRAMRGFDVYMGHYGHDVYRAVDAGHAIITNFRHPATRLTSLYNYFRFTVRPTPEELETRDYTAVRLAKSASFEDFVLCDDPMVAMYTSDQHFRQLANTPWSMASTRSERAVADMVEAMPWFYVCEFPEASYLWARRALGWRFDRVARENLTAAGESPASVLAMPDRLYDELMARNARDLALYRLAVDRLIGATTCSLQPVAAE
jgi:hypothetical protein